MQLIPSPGLPATANFEPWIEWDNSIYVFVCGLPSVEDTDEPNDETSHALPVETQHRKVALRRVRGGVLTAGVQDLRQAGVTLLVCKIERRERGQKQKNQGRRI